MNLPDDVKPITDLKNRTSALLNDVAERGRSILITQNGKAKAVLLNVDEYSRMRNVIAMLKLIAQGEADLREGRTVSSKSVLRRIQRAIRDTG